jgi:hypothetical protein
MKKKKKDDHMWTQRKHKSLSYGLGEILKFTRTNRNNLDSQGGIHQF